MYVVNFIIINIRIKYYLPIYPIYTPYPTNIINITVWMFVAQARRNG